MDLETQMFFMKYHIGLGKGLEKLQNAKDNVNYLIEHCEPENVFLMNKMLSIHQDIQNTQFLIRNEKIPF